MPRILTILIAAAGVFHGTLSAQERPTEIFAPFVSRLRAAAETSRVVLSWKNSEDLSGSKRIYRSSSELTDATFKNATMIARVAPETESYIDTPPPGQMFFYAVIIEDRNGEPYNVFIPYRNKTIAGVSLHAVSSENDAAAEITGLSAAVSGDTVTVSFVPSNKTRRLVLYRSTAPITGPADLSRAAYSITLSPGTDRQKDVPLPGIDYYYAVVDATLLNEGKASLTPGRNATVAPVQVPLPGGVSRAGTVRARTYPLPAPHILYAVDTGKELLPPLPFLLPPTLPLTPAARERVDKVIERIHRPAVEPVFELLTYEQAPNLEGDDKRLQTIAVAGAGDYKEFINAINEFLNAAHSVEAEKRARFYLGQAYYLRGQYREAVNEFVYASSTFFMETQRWTDACLEKLSSSGK